MFTSNECLAVCVRVCGCVLDLLSVGLQEGLTDCVWEVERKNSRDFNHVSLRSTKTLSHTHTHPYARSILYSLGRWLKKQEVPKNFMMLLLVSLGTQSDLRDFGRALQRLRLD